MPVPAGAPDLSRPGRDRVALCHRKAHRQECLCYLDCAQGKHAVCAWGKGVGSLCSTSDTV